ncbi:MAG: excinuclease ABC subunit B [Spirochaeta sp.]|nr:excinuclease ABC subunit B [Spirochaeta sp.]
MGKTGEITDILNNWAYDPEDQVRIIRAGDGHEVLQVRKPLGIEQYEMDGRPDGMRPFAKNSVLEEYQSRLEAFKVANGTDQGFVISRRDFTELHEEGILYYYRYLVLFQIGDFTRTAGDTEHNLKICDLVDRYGESEEDKNELLQYRPYITRMFAISKAMISLHQEFKSAARGIIESAIEEIEDMPDIDTPAFQFERLRSLNYLQSTLKQMVGQRFTVVDGLQKELEIAVAEEDYEKAADLRDKIKDIGQEQEF